MDYVPSQPLETALRRLPHDELCERLQHIRRLGDERWMRYFDDQGRARRIEMALKPWVITRAQFRVFHDIVCEIVRGLAKLPELFRELPEVREILPLSAAQARWIRLEPPRPRRPLAVLGRIDATCPFSHPQWLTHLRFLEPNSVGVGGIHYAPTNSQIVSEVMGDVVKQALPRSSLALPPDPRKLLLGELRSVARALKSSLRTVALIENTDYTSGMDEFDRLAEFFKAHGLKARVVDPRRLTLRRGRVMHGATPIDLVYRDCELAELIEMEQGGSPLAAMRQAFREGRVISAARWEFDLKSAWEIFTSPAFSRYFTKRQQAIFHRHVPWTRLLRQAFVSDPNGKRVDLATYARRHKDELVLKSNSLFGGEGIVIGETVSQAAWDGYITQALEGQERYVVQEAVPIVRETIPLMLTPRKIQFVEAFTVCGFFFNSSTIGMAGRFSREPVVNVSRGGGMIPLLVCRP